MKTPNLKSTKKDTEGKSKFIPKKKLNLEKIVPYAMIFFFIVMGITLILFGYYIFNRDPEESVVSNSEKELGEFTIKFDKNKIEKLFDSTYDTSRVKKPSFIPKNPFTGF